MLDLDQARADLLSEGKGKPLSAAEKKSLAKANVFAMDYEADAGLLPPRIDKLTSKPGKLSPSEAREMIVWFEKTAPGNY